MPRWDDLWRDLSSRPEIKDTFRTRYPYAEAAIAVAELRARHGLTQAGLAARIGSTQSVIARLESGRHPVELTAISRISEALDEPWHLAFGTRPQADLPEGSNERPGSAGADVDQVLAAFNDANTAGRFADAAEIAERMRSEPLTSRRALALALAAYNQGDNEAAERAARSALAGDLPDGSRETALLVRSRSLLRLGRPGAAVRQLRSIPTPTQLGWLVPAAFAEAHLELDQLRAARREADRALIESAGSPEARYLAARIAWHDDRVWEALGHIAVFRAAEPDDPAGLLLHGSVLGFIGEQGAGEAAYAQALPLFEAAIPSGQCEAIRLYAQTLARLGNWREAFRRATVLLEMTDHDLETHRHRVDHIVVDAIERTWAEDPVATEPIVKEAIRRFGPSPWLRRKQAMLHGLRGDVAAALASLELTEDELSSAPAEDQLAVAAAYDVAGDEPRLYVILQRIRADLPVPAGLVRYAESALRLGHVDVARSVLAELEEGGAAIGNLARVAISLLDATEAAEDVANRLKASISASSTWQSQVPPASPTPALSTWEGHHGRGSIVLDRLTGRFAH